ncbi:MAG: hypothetical protein ACRDOL_25930 [Streptosporangiaceae bacterium]
MTADMSVVPEIARLADAVPILSSRHAAGPDRPGRPRGQESSQGAGPATRLTLGALARELRLIAAAPERWWSLVRFERDHPVKVMVQQCASYHAWLMILPPGGTGQSCGCEVAMMIVGEATEGTPPSAVLRPGPVRVHGGRHGLRSHGPGYSISLHARALRPGIHPGHGACSGR